MHTSTPFLSFLFLPYHSSRAPCLPCPGAYSALIHIPHHCLLLLAGTSSATFQDQSLFPRGLHELSSWSRPPSSTSSLLDAATSPEEQLVATEGRRAQLLEREGALTRWATALELAVTKLQAGEVVWKRAQGEVEKRDALVKAAEAALKEEKHHLQVLVRGGHVD